MENWQKGVEDCLNKKAPRSKRPIVKLKNKWAWQSAMYKKSFTIMSFMDSTEAQMK